MYPIPTNEPERLAAVRALRLLDTAPEVGYDEIGELAAQITACPVAYVSLMDDDRLWLKAKYGLPPDFYQCPREIAFCATTVCGSELVLAPDLRQDARFNQIPFVVGEPHFKFYCGMPLVTSDGYSLGTLCVMDFEPREMTFEQTEAIRRLARQVRTQLELRRMLVELEQSVKELSQAKALITAEMARTEELLLNILPVSIAEELKAHGKVQPKYVPTATILFTDFREFTLLAERTEPGVLVGLLDQYFSLFDDIVVRHGLEKLKTIGDAYMAVGGVPVENRRHQVDAGLAAMEINAAVARMKKQREKMRLPSLEVRIGIHTGPVMSGVVGRRKFTFDIWGDSVNTASLMEANGAPGRINVSETVAGRVKTLFELESRGAVDIKHGRSLGMYFLDRLKPELSRDAEGRVPNEKFVAECNRLSTGFAAQT
ncbi:MAG: adenylate/guanylate cyclase domain-containing protein [Betaproteobacteria bacterium]